MIDIALKKSRIIYQRFILLCICLFALNATRLHAQEVEKRTEKETRLPMALQRRQRIIMERDTLLSQAVDTTLIAERELKIDSVAQNNMENEEQILSDSISLSNATNMKELTAPIDTANLIPEDGKKDKKQLYPETKKVFIPNSAKATWMAVIFPGGGQIYNRKYWKLPIVYGGFVGCAYALTWNGQMYDDYSQAYLDIMDDNPDTDSFLDFLPPGYNVDANMEYLKKVIKRKKDFYRRNRDLSIFAFIGVYLVSIIDAYVDAELASFDISKDLSMKMKPTIINDRQNLQNGNSYGLQCSIKF